MACRAAAACQMLEHINSLYTVYTRLVVYDRQGCIVAASRPTCQDGSSVLGTWVASHAGRRARPAQHAVLPRHALGPFAAGRWQEHLRVHAAIRAPDNDGSALGGIGVVFNASGEFAAMLHGAVAGKPNTVAVFVDRHGDSGQPIPPAPWAST